MSSGGDILGGAAEGAAAGAAVGGFVGAAVGGVIGAVGGLFKSKSKKYARKANAELVKAQDLAAAIERRNIVIEGYAMRAQQVARAAATDEGGGLMSSAPMGAIGSTRRQLATNLAVYDKSTGYRRAYAKYRGKADKYAAYAGNMQAVGAFWGTYGGGIIDSARRMGGPGPGAYSQQPGGGGVGPVLPK